MKDTTEAPPRLTEFRLEIERTINRYSMENESNTPDWILAVFLCRALESFDEAINARDKWYGIKANGLIASTNSELIGSQGQPKCPKRNDEWQVANSEE